jgi:hypothetical protein
VLEESQWPARALVAIRSTRTQAGPDIFFLVEA